MSEHKSLPLRVAMVASSLRRGGAEKQSVYMARALVEAGIDLRFFHLGENGPYQQVLRETGVPLVQIYRPRRPWFILAGLLRAFFHFRPQVVVVPQFGDLLQGGVAGRFYRAFTLGGVRSDGFYELNEHGWRSRWMVRSAHGLLANSHGAKQNLASRGVNPEKVAILPNVIDLEEFDARSKASFSVPGERIVAVAVGSLHPCKRFDRFLEALALARHKAPSLFGVIAGADQGVRSQLEKRADELELIPHHLLFTGECDNVPALLARSHFLVLCSDYEGFPNVILEAMSASLPVITTPVGDAAMIVKEDETGYVVQGDHLETMAERMVRLALSPETRVRLGTEGRHRVAQDYSYKVLTLRLLSLFHDFAVQNGRGRLVEILQERLLENPTQMLSETALVSSPAAGMPLLPTEHVRKCAIFRN